MRRLALLSMICFAAVTARPAYPSGPGPEPSDARLYLDTVTTFCFDNIEDGNRYREGRTFTGAYTCLSLMYSKPRFDLSLGAFSQRDFGDEDGVSQALPLFCFRYRVPGLQLIAGHIESRWNHGLPEAIVARQYTCIHPEEEGVQLQGNVKNLKTDLWIKWFLLNTPEHREFFAAGFHAEAAWPSVYADMGGRVTHHGGELFDTGQVGETCPE